MKDVATPLTPPSHTADTSVILTDQQQHIVAHTHGPALVFAVAGAGKTTAMVHRVERLVRERVFAPKKILLSSFSKPAVADLGRALARWPHCAPVARLTLHALGYKIVGQAADGGRLPRLATDGLKINGDERQLLWAARDLARQRGLVAPGDLDALDEQDLLNYISACKGNLRYPDLDAAGLSAEALTVATQAEAPPNLPWYLDLYRLHEEVRQERRWLTFDDMLLLGWETLVRHPDFLAQWQRRYDAVVIDEFQDVNLAQAEILDLLTRPHQNYMAVGDDDQTIYGFRGASMGFFRDFGRRYTAAIYEMTDNFRCQASQVVLANRVIAQNRVRHPKTLVVTRGFGGITALRCASDAAAMSSHMVTDIRAAQADGMNGADITVLVRITAQTPPVEQALITAGIPYRIAGEEPFFRRPEVVTLLKYTELAGYDADLRAGRRLDGEQGERFVACWRSLYNRPKRYLTRQFFEETRQAVLRQGRPLSEALVDLSATVADRLTATLHSLADLLVWLVENQDRLPAEALLGELDWRLGYQDFLIENSGFAGIGAGYAANVAAFIDYARGKGTLAEFRVHLETLAAARTVLEPDDPQVVDIRTIHKAKGLEWPVVLVPNCNAGIIPAGNAGDIEEERRLLYVAITRARQRLYLYATAGRDAQLSPFLADAGVDATLGRVVEVQRVLAADPLTWSAPEALGLLLFPRQYGQERFFHIWWGAALEEQRRIAGRLLAFVGVVVARDGLGRLGITDADVQHWSGYTPLPDPHLDAPFPGIDALCPPRTAPPSIPRSVMSRQPTTRKATSLPYQVGDRVRHPVFGQGVVVGIDAGTSGRTVEWYLSVEFRSRGLVKLLANIAPLTREG